MGFFFGNKEELERKIEDLTEEVNRLGISVASKNTTIATLKDENNQLKGNIVKESDRAATLQKQIEILSKEIRDKEAAIDSLRQENEEYKSKSLSGRQMEIVEKNLKDNQRIIAEYKTSTEALHKALESLRDEKESLASRLEACGMTRRNPEKGPVRYKIILKDFFPKYKDIVENLTNLGFSYIQELEPSVFEEKLPPSKNLPEARKEFLRFLENKMSWDIRMAFLKGEKILKIFSGKRKFTNFARENYLEFMDDLTDFDWQTLQDADFTKSQILEVIDIAEQYFAHNTL
ncbi:MAG: hypothetical protein LBQ96_03210 [Fusobacteriaceae bacterium]|jgi:FtsZ-binding cell division protein ZapB|nr:hypothetical protein [Fusobacteriaceae bacterium]